MTEKEMKLKLDQAARLINEVYNAAQLKYGNDAQVFFESESFYVIMTAQKRQSHIKVKGDVYCHISSLKVGDVVRFVHSPMYVLAPLVSCLRWTPNMHN